MDPLSTVLHRPTAQDDKYSRGVVGFVTGSVEYPGAAILGVTAAIRTGVGMVRYLGPESVARMLLEVRAEVVLQAGRAQAWVIGSGIPAEPAQASRITEVLADATYAVIDAGALELSDYESLTAKAVLTPHAGELERLFKRFGVNFSRSEIEADPLSAAETAAKLTKQVVLLKGNITTISSPDGRTLQTPPASPALATAGSGDVLAGILGALMATNARGLDAGEFSLSEIAYAGSILHARAGALAAEVGPIAALDIAEAVRLVVGQILA
jgi:ADP-dependent NAD(P)H-hydrate dehydratase / NAD(P)H-hydrate epimerase